MGELLFLFGSAFLVGFSGAMSPGTLLTATISEVMKRGFWAGPKIVLGHALLEIAVLAAVVAGLAAWIQKNAVMGVLGVGGGILLIALGLQMAITAKKSVEQALNSHADDKLAIRGPMITGIIMSLANPYWTLWWATIGLNFASIALKSGVPGLLSFYTGHILSDLVWYSIVSAAVASGRKICPPWVYQLLFVVCGLMLVGLGVYFFGSGVSRF